MSHYYISSRLANAMAGTQDPNEIYHLLNRRGTAKIRRPIIEQTVQKEQSIELEPTESSEGHIEDAPEPIPESIPESTEPIPPEEEQQN